MAVRMSPLIFYVLFLAVIIGFAGLRVVRQTNRAVVETFGKYTSFVHPGLTWIIPIIQRLIPVNVTQMMTDIEPQEIITEDNLNAKVDLVVYYQVKDDEQSVKSSLYAVNNFSSQIETLARTTARNVIGGMLFRDVNSKRKTLNDTIASILGVETAKWGVEVVRVEMKEIIPPQDVQETMNQVIKAENSKRAAIDFATAKETEADGVRRATIKEAEGKKQASILEAEGQAKAFDLINESFQGNAQLLKKLDVTERSLRSNAKIILTDKGITPQLIIGEVPLAPSGRVTG